MSDASLAEHERDGPCSKLLPFDHRRQVHPERDHGKENRSRFDHPPATDTDYFAESEDVL